MDRINASPKFNWAGGNSRLFISEMKAHKIFAYKFQFLKYRSYYKYAAYVPRVMKLGRLENIRSTTRTSR